MVGSFNALAAAQVVNRPYRVAIPLRENQDTRWPGGKQPATVEVDVQTSAVDERVGSALPAQSRSQIATTVSAPLGAWVVIATSGQAPVAGSYSSNPRRDVRRLLQIRVSVD